jgi:hypothetical protein
MKKWHCVTLAVLALATSTASAKCKPVVGHFEAQVVAPGTGHCPDTAPFCTAGRVWGGIQGNYQFVMSGLIPSDKIGGVASIVFFAGQSTVSLKSGDQVIGIDTGSIDLPPGQGGFASLITFAGGTGKMSGATGQARLRGDFDAVAGTTSGDYLGSLCTP